MIEKLEELYKPISPERPYTGQLDPEFQQLLSHAHANLSPHQCHFYHTVELANGEIIPGGWDLRGLENNYLGHILLKDLRILECGPASGFLSFHLDQAGAEVVALDLPPGHSPDLVPLPGTDLIQHRKNGAGFAEQVRNAWWYCHRRKQSSAAMVYADIYSLPGDLGKFDVTTFGAILLHLANPFKALSEAAAITEKAIVVTDLIPGILYGDRGDNLLEFNPGSEEGNLVNWWGFSPTAMARMMAVLGFPYVDTTYFEIEHHRDHDPKKETTRRYMYCMVAQREPESLPRLERTPEDMQTDRRLREEIPVINTEKWNSVHERLQDVSIEVEQLTRLSHESRQEVERLSGLLREAQSELERHKNIIDERQEVLLELERNKLLSDQQLESALGEVTRLREFENRVHEIEQSRLWKLRNKLRKFV
jgi:O-methyltransferase